MLPFIIEEFSFLENPGHESSTHPSVFDKWVLYAG